MKPSDHPEFADFLVECGIDYIAGFSALVQKGATPGAASPAQDAQRALEHYHTDIDHYKQMVIRALSSLQEDLSLGRAPMANVDAAPTDRPEAKVEPEIGIEVPSAAEKAAPAAKKSRSKKSESLNAWPEQDGEDEVETFHIGKKS